MREARNREMMASNESKTEGGRTERGVAPRGCGTEAGSLGNVKNEREFARHGGRHREEQFMLKAQHVQRRRGMRRWGRPENSEKRSLGFSHHLTCGRIQSPPPRVVLNSHLLVPNPLL